MSRFWLILLIIGFFSITTLIFYWVATNPIDVNSTKQEETLLSITEPSVTFVNPSKGAKTPRLNLVEFSDFECVHCQSMYIALTSALKAFPNDVNLVWKNLPNPSAHPNAIPAAIAAHCADRQGKFWPYHDLLLARQQYLSENLYKQIAEEIKLDTERFASCYASKDTMGVIQKDLDEAKALGILATPTLYFGAQKIVGLVSAEELISLIQIELKKN